MVSTNLKPLETITVTDRCFSRIDVPFLFRLNPPGHINNSLLLWRLGEID